MIIYLNSGPKKRLRSLYFDDEEEEKVVLVWRNHQNVWGRRPAEMMIESGLLSLMSPKKNVHLRFRLSAS